MMFLVKREKKVKTLFRFELQAHKILRVECTIRTQKTQKTFRLFCSVLSSYTP